MKLLRTLKIVLLATSMTALLSILVSFYRNSGGPEAVALEPLAQDLTQRSHDVEHLNYDGGDVVFRVRSDVSTVTDGGVQSLTGVELQVFRSEPHEGTDRVVASQARYREAEKFVDFRQDVVVELEDGTVILADRLEADIGHKSVYVPDTFQLKRGAISGAGEGLEYDAAGRKLSVTEGISAAVPGKEGETRVSAGTMEYWPREKRIRLTRDSRIVSNRGSIRSGATSLYLNAEQQLTRLLSESVVRVETPYGRVEGNRLDVAMDPESGKVRSFRMDGSESEPARVRKESGNEVQIIRGRTIQARAANDRSDGELPFDLFRASGSVGVEWEGAGIESLTATRLVARIDPAGRIREFDLEDSVELRRRGGQDAGVSERLTSDRLRLRLGALGAIEQVHAQGHSVLEQGSRGQTRSLTGADGLDFRFQEGSLRRVRTAGAASLSERGQATDLQIAASAFEATYGAGVVERFVARGRVKTVRQEKRGTQTSDCERLEADYDEAGRLIRTTQTGNVQIMQEMSGERIALTGGKAVLNDATREFILSEQPVLQKFDRKDRLVSRTSASRFRMGLSGDGVEAFDPVQTQIMSDGLNASIQATGMQASGDSSSILYTGRPRLQYGRNQVESDRLQLDSETEDFVATGEVEGIFAMNENGESVVYNVTAESLHVERKEGKAIFSGKVVATSSGSIIRAPKMELEFQDTDLAALTRVTASGGVEIEEAERTAQGDTAIYLPAEGRVTVFGKGAQVVDSKQGKATGNKLTFFLGQERLEIEGHE